MNHQGHGLALQHPVFNQPNKISFPTIEAKRRKNHENYTSPLYPEGMGETYQLVNFEEEKPKQPNPTLVSHEGFFTDVPGFESLAEGESAKMLGSLALARQGTYFFWGYSVDPNELTAPAEDTLENVIQYMAGKRGSRTVPFVCTSRKSLWVYLALFREVGYKRGMEEHFLGSVLEGSRANYAPTPEGLQKWLDANLPYVFSGKSAEHRGQRYKTIFEVDFDAKKLGTPNRERASLEKWLTLAASDDAGNRDLGITLLHRYVHASVAPSDWSNPQAWYASNRDRIVFVESAGFWWLENPEIDRR